MNRRQFTQRGAALGILGSAGLSVWPGPALASLAEADAVSGVRAALERGAQSAVKLLGRNDGFLGNPKVRIPLPGFLEDAARLLKATGQQRKVDELVTAMNRAAEAAVPQAQALLVQAARSISIEDALRIVRGSQTSVTDFFARKTREPLTQKFMPIVTQATAKVSLAEKYNAVAAKAAKLGLLKAQDADINRHVTAKSLDGLYLMIGEEEQRIRHDPVGTGSAILKKVFGR